MAASIAEWVLMQYFFPDMHDRRKQMRERENFLRDMQFDLSTGKVIRTTEKFGHQNRNVVGSTF